MIRSPQQKSEVPPGTPLSYPIWRGLCALNGCLVGLAIATSLACAAPPPGPPPMPDILAGLRPAGSECRRDEGTQTGATEIRRADRPADMSCALSPARLDDLKLWQTAPDSVLVDVRPADEFESAHIDGALNLEPGLVRSKHFLRGKNLILVGSGKAEEEIYRLCASLKAEGSARTRVLQGGMTAWRGLDGPLVGHADRVATLPRLSASELWLESHFPANLVVLAGMYPELRKALPASRQIARADLKALKAEVKHYRSKHRGQTPVALVLIAGLSSAQAETLRRGLWPLPVLYYGEGAQAFLAGMRENQAIWAARNRVPKRSGCAW